MHKATVQPIQPAPEPNKFEAHAAIFASKLDLKDLDLNERAFLGTCQDLYRNDRGTGTPFEAFVHTIIRWTTWGNPPSPEDILDEIKDNFQPDWELTVHSIKRFLQQYPDLIATLQPAPSITPEPPASVR